MRALLLVVLPAIVAGCVSPDRVIGTYSPATEVVSVPYGPTAPPGGGGLGTSLAIDGTTAFGTTGEIGVSDAGPFPDDAITPLGGLDDLGPDPFAGDISGDRALLGGIALPGDDGSRAYFDANIDKEVYFAFDSSTLSEEAKDTLRRQAAWLQVNPNVSATIEGHTDERGTREYNLALGERRASAARGYLTALGVDASRLRKVSYGKERPAVPGSNESAWARNRRAVTELGSRSSPGPVSSLSTPDPVSVDRSAERERAAALDAGGRAAEIDRLLGIGQDPGDPLLEGLGEAPSGTDPLLNDPLLDPANDPLLGTDGGIERNPVLERIGSGGGI